MKMLTVIAEDRPGLLANITATLASAGIDILDFVGQSIGGQVVISIQAEPWRQAFRCLAEAGYRTVSHDHLLVRLDHHPGALAGLSRSLAEAGIDVQSMHIVSKDRVSCIVALETTDPERARAVLAGRLVGEVTSTATR